MSSVRHIERKRVAVLSKHRDQLSRSGSLGQTVWLDAHEMLYSELEKIRARREHEAAAEVMLLESEVRAMEKHLPAAALEGVLQRIGKLKGLLVLSFLALSVWQAVGFAGVARRRGGVDRGVQVRSVMKVRSRRRDEEVLWG